MKVLKFNKEGLLHYLSYKLLMIYGIIYFILIIIYLITMDILLFKVATSILWFISTPLIVEFLKGIASIISGGALFTKFHEIRREIIRRRNSTKAIFGALFFAVGVFVWIATLAAVLI